MPTNVVTAMEAAAVAVEDSRARSACRPIPHGQATTTPMLPKAEDMVAMHPSAVRKADASVCRVDHACVDGCLLAYLELVLEGSPFMHGSTGSWFERTLQHLSRSTFP